MNVETQLARSFDDRLSTLSQRVVDHHFQHRPELTAAYGEAGRQKCLEDATYHLKFLAAALQMRRVSLFVDYAQWAQQLLATHGVEAEELVQYLMTMKITLAAEFQSSVEQEVVAGYIDPTIAILRREPAPVKSHLKSETEIDSLAKPFLQFLLDGDRNNAARLVLSAVEGGIEIKDIYLNVFQPVQYEVGRLWHRGEITVAQEHYCTAVTQWVMSRLYPQMFSGENVGFRVVAACVAGDLHEIGLRMVTDLLELDGWNTCYVGANTPIAAVVDMVARERAQVLALSATMGYHLGPLQQTIERLRRDSKLAAVKVLVGGRPFLIEPTLVESVGADAMAKNAEDALLVAKEIIGQSD